MTQSENLLTDKRSYDKTEMDMTPMVDVTFLLLIFFMVTASFALQRSLQVPAPADSGSGATHQQAEAIDVYVDPTNTFLVTYSDVQAECPSAHELLVQLRNLKPVGDNKPLESLTVRAHVDSRHQAVVSALNAASAIGVERVQLKTTHLEG